MSVALSETLQRTIRELAVRNAVGDLDVDTLLTGSPVMIDPNLDRSREHSVTVTTSHRTPTPIRDAGSGPAANAGPASHRAATARRALGLPDHVQDPIVLARVAAMLATIEEGRPVRKRGAA